MSVQPLVSPKVTVSILLDSCSRSVSCMVQLVKNSLLHCSNMLRDSLDKLFLRIYLPDIACRILITH